MNQTPIPTFSKSKEASLSKKLDALLARFHENNNVTLSIYKDIEKLKRSNEVSFKRAKKAVEALGRN